MPVMNAAFHGAGRKDHAELDPNRPATMPPRAFGGQPMQTQQQRGNGDARRAYVKQDQAAQCAIKEEQQRTHRMGYDL